MKYRLLIIGTALWAVATIALRYLDRFIFPIPTVAATVALLVASFAAMAVLVHALFVLLGVSGSSRAEGAIILALPTLILDAFASAFFPVIYPDVPASASGLFGGWMLICCAGAVTGAIALRERLVGAGEAIAARGPE